MFSNTDKHASPASLSELDARQSMLQRASSNDVMDASSAIPLRLQDRDRLLQIGQPLLGIGDPAIDRFDQGS